MGVVQISFSVDKMLYPMLKSDTKLYGVVLKTVEKFVTIQYSMSLVRSQLVSVDFSLT